MRVCAQKLPKRWFCLVSLAYLLVLGFTSAGYAEWKQTTEFGVTVTPEELWTEMDVSRRFWSRVRHCVSSEKFSAANPALRQQAAQALEAISDELADRAFKDETIRDLLHYICSRYRTYELLRQLRGCIDDDRVFFRLHAAWEDHRYECLQLSTEEKQQSTEQLFTHFAQRLKAAELSPEQQEQAMELWKRLNACVEHMYSLEAGKALIRQKQRCWNNSPELQSLMCQIVRAANWAMITHPTRKNPPSTEDFLRAWKNCAALESQADKDIWRTVK